MKNKLQKLLCLSLAILFLLSFAACGKSGSDDDDDEDDKKGSSSIAGSYSFVSMTSQGETLTAEDMGELASSMYLILNEDGTGKLAMFGETLDMEWKDGKIWPVTEPESPVPFRVNGDELVMEQDGQKITFQKTDSITPSNGNMPSNDDNTPTGAIEESISIYGTYYFSYMENDGVSITAADMEAAGQDSSELYVTVNSDGTGVFCMYGEVLDMEWADDMIWPVTEPDAPVSFTFDGQQAIMQQDGQKIVFGR